MNNPETFLKKSEEVAFDIKHRKTINHNIGLYDEAVKNSSSEFSNYELARKRISYLKTQVMENLDKYLIEFENHFTKNGGKVIWACDKEEAQQEIIKIIKKSKARTAVKAKSMTTEEIGLKESLSSEGVETIETDLGEYIMQVADQKPYHMVTPAMHLSKTDISTLFKEKLNMAPTEDVRELTLFVRKLLREKFLSAEVGITGANFLIADVGGVAVTENEGNARLATAFPKTHIVVAGIEKLIPRMEDLGLFWPMLAHSGTGQRLTVYNTIFTGPRKAGETDGPDEMYVVLLDNGRTDLLADFDKRQALNCIRCGACLNICPVYKNIGGHSYGTTYSGPIGSVITPHYEGMKEFKHLSFASTLCGACTTVCPVKIDLHNLLLLNRQQSVKEKLTGKKERLIIQFWKKGMKNRKFMNFGGKVFKQLILGILYKETWGKRRRTPNLAPRSFNQLWKDRNVKK